MKKLLFPAAALAAVMALTVMPSCKKGEDSPTKAQMLTGTWKLTEEGVDSNRNGTWDAAEHKAVTGADAYNFAFNADGSGATSGTINGVPLSIPFKWSLQNSDNDLRIISTFGTTDTETYNIVTLNSTDLVAKDNSTSPVEYSGFKKQ